MRYLIFILVLASCKEVLVLPEIKEENKSYLPGDSITFDWLSGPETFRYEYYKDWFILYDDSVKEKQRENVLRNIDSLIMYGVDLKFHYVHISLGFERPAEVIKKKNIGEPFSGMIKVYTTLRFETFLHEAGHVYDISHNYQIETKRKIHDLFQVTELEGYAKKNTREYYAELFKNYFLDLPLSPQELDFISNNVKF